MTVDRTLPAEGSLACDLLNCTAMGSPWKGREKRQSPRIDVRTRVSGCLDTVDTPIVVHDLSRTGFAAVSQVPFPAGEILGFRLVGPDGSSIRVTALSVHTRSLPATPGLHLTGFKFVPDRRTARMPQALIDQLIDSLSVPVVAYL